MKNLPSWRAGAMKLFIGTLSPCVKIWESIPSLGSHTTLHTLKAAIALALTDHANIFGMALNTLVKINLCTVRHVRAAKLSLLITT
jgi:hypothetical protein